MSRGGGLITAIIAIFAALFIGWLTVPSGTSGTVPISDAPATPATKHEGERAGTPPAPGAPDGAAAGAARTRQPGAADPTAPATEGAGAAGSREGAGGQQGDARKLPPGLYPAAEALRRIPKHRRGPPGPDGFSGDRAADRAIQLEERVTDLLTTVAPELDGAAISRSCTPNGRSCTFEGPWPGDDFASRWVDAISTGEVGDDSLGGATFSTFERVEGPDGDRFVIEAKQPPGRVLE